MKRILYILGNAIVVVVLVPMAIDSFSGQSVLSPWLQGALITIFAIQAFLRGIAHLMIYTLGKQGADTSEWEEIID